jgi:hypothetical protein
MSRYQEMQALARCATHEQMITAASSLGWTSDTNALMVNGIRLGFLSPLGRARFTPDQITQAQAQQARRFLGDHYDDRLEQMYYGCSTFVRRRGPESAAVARAEDEVCLEICDALRSAGVELGESTEREQALRVCHRSLATI